LQDLVAQNMIGYVTIGVVDEGSSLQFYDALFLEIGCERKFSDGGWTGYGHIGKDDHDVYIVAKTSNSKLAHTGNGIIVAFKAGSKSQVEAAHKAGLAAGGIDEGKPGPRPPESTIFFGAYLRDPTLNKICVYYKSDVNVDEDAVQSLAKKAKAEELTN
jgi:hypothetical protein